MNIAQLEYFVMAVDSGSYASASKKLFVNPSTMSLAIAHLEEEIGVKLLERSRLGISPTVQGKRFYEMASGALSLMLQLKAFSSQPDKRNNSHSIHLAVASLPWRGALIGRRILESFRTKNRNIEVNVYEESSSVCMKLLERKVVDAALVMAPCEDDSYQSERVLTKRVCVLRNEACCSLESEKVSIGEILSSPVALPTDVDCLFEGIMRAFARHNSQPCFRFVKPSIQDVERFVMEDDGVVFTLSDSNVRSYYPNLKLSRLNPADDFSIPVFLVRGRTESPAVLEALSAHICQFNTSTEFGRKRQ